MKKHLSLILAALFALAILAGCGGARQETKAPAAGEQPQTASKTPTLDRIKQEGKLVIGTSPDYPPFESLDEKNNVIGFDIDIMQEVANKLGVRLEIVQIGFDGLIPALNAKKFDIMAAGVSVTPDRQKEVDFTKPYIAGRHAVVVHKDSDFAVGKLEDLKGKKVAVQIGTVQADALKAVEGITVKEYNLFTEAAQAVSAKQAEAMFLDKTVAEAFMAADKNLKIVFEVPAEDTAYALRKDTPDLTQFVSDVLTELEKSGKFSELVAKWFK